VGYIRRKQAGRFPKNKRMIKAHMLKRLGGKPQVKMFETTS